jgi:hypothetical protein
MAAATEPPIVDLPTPMGPIRTMWVAGISMARGPYM